MNSRVPGLLFASRGATIVAVVLVVSMLGGPAEPAHADTFTVTNTNDSGAGSLRAAILSVNGTSGGPHTINFAIPGAGPHVIQPTSALPLVTHAVIVDGYSQPGAKRNTLADGDNADLRIVLDGSLAPAGTNGVALNAGGSRVSGLVIGKFKDNQGIGGNGIFLSSGTGSSVVEGNFIGVDPTGSVGRGNGYGVFAFGPSPRVGGTSPGERNVISGQAYDGVLLANLSNAIVQGNFIGTTRDGLSALGNGGNGVDAQNTLNVTIGGSVAGARNVIAGNGLLGSGFSGVIFSGGVAAGNAVLGNYIGVDVTGTAAVGNGLNGVHIDNASNTTVGGLSASARNVISGNSGNGITIDGANPTGNLVQGNYIGTNATGTLALGNSGAGVVIDGGANNTVGGGVPTARNIISGNLANGLTVGATASGSLIQGNYIGTDVAGLQDLGNALSGVSVGGPNNTIGGTDAGARNVVSGNGFYGVALNGVNATGNLVQGNYIGVGASGALGLGNGADGVIVANGGSDNVIGGVVPGARNIISGNQGNGLTLGSSATTNLIEGNYVGTDAAGLLNLGNALRGVVVNGPNNVVGGSAGGARNVVSGNGFSGVVLNGANATGNQVQGNYIGVDATGALGLGNGVDGVFVGNGAANNVVGGVGNTIAFNAGRGVLMVSAGEGNRVSRNAIFSNGALGIDLANDGVSPNDPGDPDTGSNGLQNFPVLGPATTTSVQGSLSSKATTTYTVELFASPACDPSGFGEGQLFVGSTQVTTDAGGAATFQASFATALANGQRITATATDPNGSTSEFSACVIVGFIPTSTPVAATPTPTRTSTPTASPTASATPTPSRTATLTTAVAGRRLVLQSVVTAGPANQEVGARIVGAGRLLSWQPGTQTKAVVLRHRTPPSLSYLPSLASPLSPGATSYLDDSLLPDPACYAVIAFLGDFGAAVQAVSDVLCIYPVGGGGAGAPGGFSVSLNDGDVAELHWTAPGGQSGYELTAVRFDGAGPRTLTLGANADSVSDNTGGAMTCYRLRAIVGGQPQGGTDVLCAVPGVSTFRSGLTPQAAFERLGATFSGALR